MDTFCSQFNSSNTRNLVSHRSCALFLFDIFMVQTVSSLIWNCKMQKRAPKSLVILYTGGTIGSVPLNSNQLNSPLIPAEDALQVLLQLPSFDSISKTVVLRGVKFPSNY